MPCKATAGTGLLPMDRVDDLFDVAAKQRLEELCHSTIQAPRSAPRAGRRTIERWERSLAARPDFSVHLSSANPRIDETETAHRISAGEKTNATSRRSKMASNTKGFKREQGLRSRGPHVRPRATALLQPIAAVEKPLPSRFPYTDH